MLTENIISDLLGNINIVYVNKWYGYEQNHDSTDFTHNNYCDRGEGKLQNVGLRYEHKSYDAQLTEHA